MKALRDCIEKLGWSVNEGKAISSDGKERPFLLTTHGGEHQVILVPTEDGKHADVLIEILLHEDDVALLGKQSQQVKRQLMAILRREMLEGRSGYAFVPHPTDKLLFLGIRISQSILLDDSTQGLQRLMDAKQEVVVVAMRCVLVLGHVFDSVKATELPPDPEHVYI